MRPVVWGTLASLVAAPVLVVTWYVGAIFIHLESGGTLGGIGAPVEQGASWGRWAALALAIALAVLDIVVGVAVWWWNRRRVERSNQDAAGPVVG